jgi:NADPH:quinone reductase-like Zn-dependent oxidoreductase
MIAAYTEEAGGPEKIQVGELAQPVPQPDQVLIRSRAAGKIVLGVGVVIAH